VELKKKYLSVVSMNCDKWLAVWIAVKFGRDCLPIWTERRPSDIRPMVALETAEAWLKYPETASLYDARAAARDSNKAAEAAVSSMNVKMSSSCPSIAYSCAHIAELAGIKEPKDDSYHGGYPIYPIAFSAANALGARGRRRIQYVHRILDKNLPFIIDYKIKHGQKFRDFEEVFSAASDKNKEKLLFLLGDQ